MSHRDSLSPYKGGLSPAQAAEGIMAAMENAKALLADAELLLNNERWARACAIAILAIEEAGKVSILRALLLARDSKELKKEWRGYRRHTSKNVAWILPSLAAAGARKLDDLRPIFDDESTHPRLLDTVKQIAFYSDAVEDCHWTVPSEVIDEETARTIVRTAEVLVPLSGGAMTTEAELEIWVKHLGPVWKKDMNLMKMALHSAYAEAHEKGVLQGDHSPDDFAAFVGLYFIEVPTD